MISSNPIWTHQPRHGDPAHFDAFLHDGVVAGSWFCASLDGVVKWDRTNRHANRIFCIAEGGILVGTHYRKRGCHAFEIETGNHIWSFPKWNVWNKTYPVQQNGDTIICSGGEHLNLKTGALIKRARSSRVSENEQPKWVKDHLALTTSWTRDPERSSQRLDVLHLLTGISETARQNGRTNELASLDHRSPLVIGRNCESGSAWEFSFQNIPYAWQFGIHNLCFNHPYIYIVVPESPNLKSSGCFVESTPTTYRFLALNCQTGHVDQDIPLGSDWCGCTIEDINNSHILFSFWKRRGWNAACFVSLYSLTDVSAG